MVLIFDKYSVMKLERYTAAIPVINLTHPEKIYEKWFDNVKENNYLGHRGYYELVTMYAQ